MKLDSWSLLLSFSHIAFACLYIVHILVGTAAITQYWISWNLKPCFILANRICLAWFMVDVAHASGSNYKVDIASYLLWKWIFLEIILWIQELYFKYLFSIDGFNSSILWKVKFNTLLNLLSVRLFFFYCWLKAFSFDMLEVKDEVNMQTHFL